MLFVYVWQQPHHKSAAQDKGMNIITELTSFRPKSKLIRTYLYLLKIRQWFWQQQRPILLVLIFLLFPKSGSSTLHK